MAFPDATVRRFAAQLKPAVSACKERVSRHTMTNHPDPFADFDGIVRSLEEIRAHIGGPPPSVLAKVMDSFMDEDGITQLY
jgi:hypothetical protein